MNRSLKQSFTLIVWGLMMLSCSTDHLEENVINNESKTTKKKVLEEPYEEWMAEFKGKNLNDVFEEELNIPESSITDSIAESATVAGRGLVQKPIYAHYMPWFQSKEIDGTWGQHWTMTNRNPDIVDEEGKRQIASHYYPLIGPYSTKDKDLQQYHLLLMKLSGVDGVIFDWYGIRDVNDFNNIKEGMESFLKELDKTKLEFAVMYEDRVVEVQARSLTPIQISQAQNDLNYIRDTYFPKDNYIKIDNKELLMIFGPNFIDETPDWDSILSSFRGTTSILPLWNARNVVGQNNSTGEYAWIDEGHIETLQGYYNNNADFNGTVGGIAYPRFDDYYVEGGWRPASLDKWEIDEDGGRAFDDSFAESNSRPVDFIQIATWNDFGEGTIVEPTKESGFQYLEKLQTLTNVRYKKEDLKLPYYIYKLKKQFPNSRVVQFLTKRAYKYAIKGRMYRARMLVCLLMMFYGHSFM